MRNPFLRLYVMFQNLTSNEQGQDLVEYALLLTMISLALIAGINGIAKAANGVFANVSSSLA